MIGKLSGYRILPGLINAHDHLEFALFPRLGKGTYANSTEWAKDIYRPSEPPVSDHLRVPMNLRLVWGGLRNLIAGVTTVCHHNPYHAVFDNGFPIRVVKRFGWAHSFEFSPDIERRWKETPRDAPFILHLGEGIDRHSAEEIFRLERMGALTPRTAIVHAVALDQDGWRVLRQRGAGAVWCPRSNLFTLGRTISREIVTSGLPIALATDSPITSDGDMLDELAFASSLLGRPLDDLLPLVTGVPAGILRLTPHPDDWIAVPEFGQSPELVMIGGRVQLVGQSLLGHLPASVSRSMHPLCIEGRRPVYVCTDTQRLLKLTRDALGTQDIRLGGRLVET